LVIPAKDSVQTNIGSDVEIKKRFSTDTDETTHDKLSVDHLSQHNRIGLNLETEWIVVRIEVSDTGCGIQQKDMDRGKLFSKSCPS
jgi:signal transduction histidine kinase